MSKTPRLPIPCELPIEQVVAIIDTREQTPWDLSPMQVVRSSLVTGDYSVWGLQDYIAIERKSLSDLLGCIGKGRDRFERELKRFEGIPERALIIESSAAEILRGEWQQTATGPGCEAKRKVSPASVIGSLERWSLRMNVILAGNREAASQKAQRLLYLSASARWDEAREFIRPVLFPEHLEDIRAKEDAKRAADGI